MCPAFFAEKSFSIMPPLLTQPLGVSGWAQVIESLSHSRDQLLALPPSHGQTHSNEELFDSILADVLRMITKGDSILVLSDSTASEDDEWEYDL